MKANNVWDIQTTLTLLTRQICDLLSFLQALTGSDTTFLINGISKQAALKTLRASTEFQNVVQQFMASNVKGTLQNLERESAVIILIYCKANLGLIALQFHRFATNVT